MYKEHETNGSQPPVTERAVAEQEYRVPVSLPATPSPGKARLLLVLALMGLLLIGGCSYLAIEAVRGVRGVQAEGARVGDTLLGRLRDYEYTVVWQEAAPEFQAIVSQEEWTSFLAMVEEQVGRPQSWQLTGFNRQVSDGVTTTTYTYAVTHVRGSSTATVLVDSQQRLLRLDLDIKISE